MIADGNKWADRVPGRHACGQMFMFPYWSTICLSKIWTLGFTLVVLSVCLCVCLCVTRDLRNRLMDHSEILGDVRGEKSKNRHTAAFFN